MLPPTGKAHSKCYPLPRKPNSNSPPVPRDRNTHTIRANTTRSVGEQKCLERSVRPPTWIMLLRSFTLSPWTAPVRCWATLWVTCCVTPWGTPLSNCRKRRRFDKNLQEHKGSHTLSNQAEATSSVWASVCLLCFSLAV